jgi:hypothetical protein
MEQSIGAKLAELANARKKAEDEARVAKQLRENAESEVRSANVKVIDAILAPHIEEFNKSADAGLRLSISSSDARILINRGGDTLLSLEITHIAVYLKRPSGSFSPTDDHFAIETSIGGKFTLRKGLTKSAVTPEELAEIILTEALCLKTK